MLSRKSVDFDVHKISVQVPPQYVCSIHQWVVKLGIILETLNFCITKTPDGRRHTINFFLHKLDPSTGTYRVHIEYL